MATTQFTLIPWDMDFTMKRPTPMDPVPHWSDTNVDCDHPFPIFKNESAALAPSCDPILGSLALDLERYSRAVDALLDKAFDIERIANDIDGYAEFIYDEVERDPLASIDEWAKAVKTLKDGLPTPEP